MKALITGAGGFVGPYLTDHLRSCGDEVVGVDLEVDVTDGEGVRKAFLDARPEAVYHLAAASHVGTSWSAPVDVLRVNAEGSLNVFLAALDAGVERVLLIGSAEQYGRISPELLPVVETTPLQPVSPYGASKAAAEMMASHAFHGRGLPVVSVRAFNHLGPGQSEALVASTIAKQVAEAERAGGGVVHTGNLEARRDFTDVRDVVRAYRLLVEHGQPGEAYNVCSGRDVAIQEIADHLAAQARAEVRFEVDPERLRPVDVPVVRGDNAKLRAATGWSPEIPLEQTLGDILAWWRQRV
ncbi:MAG: nucleoside-diphosphate-sugar epimerase [Actinomycetia bacterium]|nr:nucleoside-diphosphate-sugar epimerase [Actinomycetes bacterium]